jgi:DNA sulfur modification protein DndB
MNQAVLAIQGEHFGRKVYYASIRFDEVSELIDIDPDVQRNLSKSRVNKLHRYILGGGGFLPSITVSAHFPLTKVPSGLEETVHLMLKKGQKLAVNDGQHRLRAIEKAVKTNPDLGSNQIGVLIFENMSSMEQRQLFHDLNFFPTKVPKGKAVEFDSSDLVKMLTKQIAEGVTYFLDRVDVGRMSITTLGMLYESTKVLVSGTELTKNNFDQVLEDAVEYWERVGEQLIDAWEADQVTPNLSTTRTTFQILGRLGNKIWDKPSDQQADIIERLGTIDWDRNSPHWMGYMISPETGKQITGSSAFASCADRLYDLLGISDLAAAGD